MLQLAEVTKRYRSGEFTLNKVSLNLGKGLHVLVGPNGAGKSTLLRLIATVMRPDTGRILFNSRDVYSNLHWFKFGLGYLPQTFGFYDHMTGMEFLRYMAGLKGIPPRLGRERADYVADLLGIRQYWAGEISAWSVGQKQLLGLAQAFLGDPDILVLDEPFCGLDPEEVEMVGQLLGRLSRDKVILISSHIVDGLVMGKLLLLNNGSLQFAGIPTVFLDEAQGCVWAVEMLKHEWFKLQQQYLVSAAIFDGDSCRGKIISETKPNIPGARVVDPTVEDAYIYWLRRSNQTSGEKGIW